MAVAANPCLRVHLHAAHRALLLHDFIVPWELRGSPPHSIHLSRPQARYILASSQRSTQVSIVAVTISSSSSSELPSAASLFNHHRFELGESLLLARGSLARVGLKFLDLVEHSGVLAGCSTGTAPFIAASSCSNHLRPIGTLKRSAQGAHIGMPGERTRRQR